MPVKPLRTAWTTKSVVLAPFQAVPYIKLGIRMLFDGVAVFDGRG